MLHKVPAVPVGVQTAVHSHSRQHEGTFRPFSRLLRQAGHTVGQFCTPKGDPGTTGGTPAPHSILSKVQTVGLPRKKIFGVGLEGPIGGNKYGCE